MPSDCSAAVVGAACRFPGADTVDEYWQLLLEGRAIALEPGADRLDLWAAARDKRLGARITTLKGGYLRDIAGFDADHFGIAPREAARLDPQQRLLLTVTHDALEDAGITRAMLQTLTTGVFVGAGSNDYMMLGGRSHETVDSYHGLGNSHSLLANRLSYYYNLKGPSLTVDTACSSSLTALHVALGSLACGEIDLAIIGGVNVIVSPELTLAFSQAGMLSPSGRCNAFSATADGYGRAEGAGVIVLMRADRSALTESLPRCVIRSTAINQDGRSNGITAPNGLSQRQVIDAAMRRAGVGVADIAYIEAHGTGTRLGDAIEFNALRDVFAKEPSAHCRVGSAKANVGHMEAAAGMGGLIKAMLMLEHGMIVPHAVEPPYNELIDQARGQIGIAQTVEPLRDGGCIGVSSFGFGGSNAHAILARTSGQPDTRATSDACPFLLMLSTHDPDLALTDAGSLAHALEGGASPLSQVAATLAHRRDRMRCRTAIVATDGADASRQLRSIDSSRFGNGDEPPRIAFVFTGQGSQYAGMGARLYASNTAFRAAFDEGAEHIRHHAGFATDDLLSGGERGADRLIDDTHLAQLAIFCLEHALARLLIDAGVVPAAVIGHSIGEIVAQTVAGMLTLDDALALVHERARLMQSYGPAGAMAGVFAKEADVRELIASSGLRIYIAAVNASTSVTVSGDAAEIEAFLSALAVRGIQARRLRSRHAFHTPGFTEAASRLATYTSGIVTQPARIPIASNIDGSLLDALPPGSDYWSRQIVAPVMFAQGIATLVAQKIDLFVELGPDRQLSQLISRDHAATGIEALSIQRRNGDGLADCLKLFGRLFERHVDFDASVIVAPAPCVHLPARALSSQPFWGGAKTTPIAARTVPFPPPAGNSETSSSSRRVIDHQLELMQRQLALLSQRQNSTSLPHTETSSAHAKGNNHVRCEPGKNPLTHRRAHCR